MSKMLFLDRDGPINILGPKGFVHKPEYFHFTDGIFDVCHEALAKDYRIVVITNQTGIGLGDYTEKDMEEVHNYMKDEFRKEGIRISDIFYTKYPTSQNRKPSPGMFLLAKEKYELSHEDMFASVAIGDRQKDAQAALFAGVGRVVYYQTSKVLDKEGRIVDRYPEDSKAELEELTKDFKTLVILGQLIQAEGQSEPIAIEPKSLGSQGPKMEIIQDYKQIQGWL